MKLRFLQLLRATTKAGGGRERKKGDRDGKNDNK